MTRPAPTAAEVPAAVAAVAEAQEAAEATVSRENEAVQYQFKLLAEHNDDTVINNRGVGGFYFR